MVKSAIQECPINKQARQLLIRELVLNHDIASQDELSRELRSRGTEVTQATLSRDLHELRIVRMPQEHGFKYIIPENNGTEHLQKVVQHEIIQISNNESCVVVKTLPGRAAGVGAYLDSIKDPSIIGTVAGNDTLIVVPRTVENTRDVVLLLQGLHN